MQPGQREGHSLLPWHREQPVPHHCRELLLSQAEISHSFHWYGKVRLLFSFKVLYIQELLQSTARRWGPGRHRSPPRPGVLLSLII